MLGHASNPMLAEAENAIQSKVQPQFQAQLQSTVEAGLHILYAPQLHDTLMHRIAASHNPPKDAGNGATRMVYQLYLQSKGSIPKEVLVPAAMILAFEYLDLLAKSGKVQVTPHLIDQATQDTGDAILTAMRITPQKLAEMKRGTAEAAPASASAADQPVPAPPAAEPAPARAGGILGNAMTGT